MSKFTRPAPKRVLITGIAGSGGSYLAEHIVNHHPDVEVHGIARWRSSRSSLDAISDRITVHESDLTDFGSLFRVLKAAQPDAVFHLAAHANVRASFDTPATVLHGNIIGTSNLFEGLRAADLNPAVLLCSSSEVYGQVKPHEVPITEENPMRPASPYSVSKVAQDLLGRTYFVAYGMPVVTTRMFTYLNPRRADLFASAFARQIARIEQGAAKELVHGNLDSIRTIIDVRDAMRAYWEILLHGEAGEVYNIGGQTVLSVAEVLQKLISMSSAEIPTRVEPKLLRPSDVTLQIPNIEKFVQATDWQPQYTFEQSIQDLLEYSREVVRQQLRAAA